VRILTIFVVLAGFLGACGGPDADGARGIAGTYLMGDAERAREKTKPRPEDPNAPRTLREMLEGEQVHHFSLSVDMLLTLREDGTFEYFGPLKMGDDPARVEGRWEHAGDVLRLRLAEPLASEDEVVAVLECRVGPGVVEYPMGRDPANPVWYRLVDPSWAGDLAPDLPGSVRVGR